MYSVAGTATFNSAYKHVVEGDALLEQKTAKAIGLLSQNPYYPSLRTHKVNSKNFGIQYSSSVSGDIRIIWNFDGCKEKSIILLAIGGHSGKYRVYNKKS